ncbi:hypothetical protein BDF14DRAFT_1790865 [Spinellus fusiger]|nr:hypothetical protein BDF14DRAFT_1790865 [Spinellus fusiger]
MADFICLAMASQYSEALDTANVPTPSLSAGLRRSFQIPQSATSLIPRRFSRSANTNNSNASTTTTTTANNNNNNNSNITSTIRPLSTVEPEETPLQRTTSKPISSLHIRIVPSIENPSRSMIFDIVDRVLEVDSVVKFGRFSDNVLAENHVSFKSKVVSRTHCEIRVENDGKLYLRDTKSSSGTFINHTRLSPANQESKLTEIKNGDIVQLGVDYQGGLEEIYRSVKMRFEVNHSQGQLNSYSMSAFNNLRNLTNPVQSMRNIQAEKKQDISIVISEPSAACTTHQQPIVEESADTSSPGSHVHVEECCICLYALAPFQALFISPCAHSYHYKCIRPLLESYPGFQCPICRSYSDLEASVAVEADEVVKMYCTPPSPSAAEPTPSLNAQLLSPVPVSLLHRVDDVPVSVSELSSESVLNATEIETDDTSHEHIELTLQETVIPPQTPQPIPESTPLPLPDPLSTFVPTPPPPHLLSTFDRATSSDASSSNVTGHTRPSNDDEEERERRESQRNTDIPNAEVLSTSLPPARRGSNLIDKLRMAFSDKRRSAIYEREKKSQPQQPKTKSLRAASPKSKKRRSNRNSRAVEDGDEDGDVLSDDLYSPSSSSSPSPPLTPGGFHRSLTALTYTLSRQSTTHNPLTEITEENNTNSHSRRQWNTSEPMPVMYCT